MDFSKFKTSDWLKVGGAVGFLIFGFLNWVSIEGGGVEYDSGNVFDFFWTGTIPWFLVLATGVITFLMVNGTMKQGSAPWPLIFLLATGLASLLMLIRVIFNPLENKDLAESLGFEVNRGIGLWVSTIATLAATAGAFMGFTESGGNLADLKDMNKMKGQFGGSAGGSTPPPPPPPGMPPPPPPAG